MMRFTVLVLVTLFALAVWPLYLAGVIFESAIRRPFLNGRVRAKILIDRSLAYLNGVK